MNNANPPTRLAGVVAALVVLLSVGAAPAFAERPMQVDDAGTPDLGEFEIEGGWSREGKVRGWDMAIGYVPVENLKVELGFVRGRDRADDPNPTFRGADVGLKWVPIQADVGLSAGVAVEYGRVRVDDRQGGKGTVRERGVLALVSWGFASGQVAHLNLGREWEREGGKTEAVNTWGVGFEQPLVERLQLTLEVFGAEHRGPSRQVGLRYEIVEGVKLSGAVGRGNDQTLANVGVSWEF